MNALYLLFNAAVLAGPLALSFDRRVGFYRHWPKVGVSIVTVGLVYVLWDIAVTRAGHWWFNPDFTGALRIAGLPLGEILFFITVPYACLFVYEVIGAYFGERTGTNTRLVRFICTVLATGAIVVAVVFRGQGYTALVMVSVAVMLVVSSILDPKIWLSSHTFVYFGFSLVLFLIANSVLTAVPIVGYGEEAIWGARVITIPLEDFFYNAGMLGLYLLVYRLAGRVIATRRRTARPVSTARAEPIEAGSMR
jgi:lycopene cyclase domain-containing protein